MTPRLASLLPLLLAVACQVPFGAQRHDLVGDRVAAIAVDPVQGPAGTPLEARAALIVDGHPWSDEAVDLGWHWVDPGDLDAIAALQPGDPADATGPAPDLALPGGPARLALVAAFPSGFVERAWLDLQGPARPAPDLEALRADPPGPWAPDATVTLTAPLDDADPPRVRWMSVQGRGTFEEQSRTVTAWTAAEIEVDDDEVVARTPLEPGPVTFLALAVDGEGGNAFTAADRWVGDRPEGLHTSSGRWLGTDRPVAPGTWTGTLVLDDDAPSGVRLVDLAGGDTGEALPCAPEGGPFDPSWLLAGHCLRPELDGARVTVEAHPVDAAGGR